MSASTSMPPPRKRLKMSQSEMSNSTENSSGMLEIRAKASSKCFACSSMPIEAAHVIGKSDRSVPLLVSSGLISCNLRSPSNGVALCPTCHAMFDQVDDPGFIFFPMDIAFFIRAELEDRERRKKEGGGRVMPSADNYKQYQVEQGLVPATAEGGLYFRCFLQEYFHVGTGYSARHKFGDPVTYHGDPFGTFRRAFAALATPRGYTMSFIVIQQLSLLKSLYFMEGDVGVLGLTDDNINPPALEGPYATNFNPQQSSHNDNSGFVAPAMPSQSTAMGPSRYARQMAVAATNDPSDNDAIERDHKCEHNRDRDWDDSQSENNGYSQHLQISPKSQPALMQVKPTFTLTPALTSKSAPSLITPHNFVPPTKSEHRGNPSIESFPIEHPPFEEEVVLGPELTANDIIRRYRPVIEASTFVL